MQPNIILAFEDDGLSLLCRAPEGWLDLGTVSFADPDHGVGIARLRTAAEERLAAGQSLRTLVLVPRAMVRFARISVPGRGRRAQEAHVLAAIDGLTPYRIDELTCDWIDSPSSEDAGDDAGDDAGLGQTAVQGTRRVDVAVVARTTLAEAEAIARAHGFEPVAFGALDLPGVFEATAWFGSVRSSAPAARRGAAAPAARADRSLIRPLAIAAGPRSSAVPEDAAGASGAVAQASPDTPHIARAEPEVPEGAALADDLGKADHDPIEGPPYSPVGVTRPAPHAPWSDEGGASSALPAGARAVSVAQVLDEISEMPARDASGMEPGAHPAATLTAIVTANPTAAPAAAPAAAAPDAPQDAPAPDPDPAKPTEIASGGGKDAMRDRNGDAPSPATIDAPASPFTQAFGAPSGGVGGLAAASPPEQSRQGAPAAPAWPLRPGSGAPLLHPDAADADAPPVRAPSGAADDPGGATALPPLAPDPARAGPATGQAALTPLRIAHPAVPRSGAPMAIGALATTLRTIAQRLHVTPLGRIGDGWAKASATARRTSRQIYPVADRTARQASARLTHLGRDFVALPAKVRLGIGAAVVLAATGGLVLGLVRAPAPGPSPATATAPAIAPGTEVGSASAPASAPNATASDVANRPAAGRPPADTSGPGQPGRLPAGAATGLPPADGAQAVSAPPGAQPATAPDSDPPALASQTPPAAIPDDPVAANSAAASPRAVPAPRPSPFLPVRPPAEPQLAAPAASPSLAADAPQASGLPEVGPPLADAATSGEPMPLGPERAPIVTSDPGGLLPIEPGPDATAAPPAGARAPAQAAPAIPPPARMAEGSSPLLGPPPALPDLRGTLAPDSPAPPPAAGLTVIFTPPEASATGVADGPMEGVRVFTGPPSVVPPPRPLPPQGIEGGAVIPDGAPPAQPSVASESQAAVAPAASGPAGVDAARAGSAEAAISPVAEAAPEPAPPATADAMSFSLGYSDQPFPLLPPAVAIGAPARSEAGLTEPGPTVDDATLSAEERLAFAPEPSTAAAPAPASADTAAAVPADGVPLQTRADDASVAAAGAAARLDGDDEGPGLADEDAFGRLRPWPPLPMADQMAATTEDGDPFDLTDAMLAEEEAESEAEAAASRDLSAYLWPEDPMGEGAEWLEDRDVASIPGTIGTQGAPPRTGAGEQTMPRAETARFGFADPDAERTDRMPGVGRLDEPAPEARVASLPPGEATIVTAVPAPSGPILQGGGADAGADAAAAAAEVPEWDTALQPDLPRRPPVLRPRSEAVAAAAPDAVPGAVPDTVADAAQPGPAAAGTPRPAPRPQALTRPAPVAVAATGAPPRPLARPARLTLAAPSQPAQAASASAAAAGPAVVSSLPPVAPSAPATATVARQATVTRGIDLTTINLIGVFGTQRNRTALVRLANGRIQRVQVGDTLDGSRVTAISDAEVRLSRDGQNITLRLPRT